MSTTLPPPAASSSPPAPLPSPGATPADLYRWRRDHFEQQGEFLAGRSNRIANLRLFIFLAALVSGAWGVLGGIPLLWSLGLVLLAIFVGFVIHHRRLEHTRGRLVGLARINAEAIQRLERDWTALPVRHASTVGGEHPYAIDLDVLGHASLMQLLDAVGSLMGERTLSRWLLGPSDPAAIRDRQAAAAELAPLVELRDELTWRTQATGDGRPDPEPLLAWAESEPWLAQHRGKLWIARISPVVLLILGGASLLGLTPYPFWLAPLLVNLWLAQTLVGPARQTIEQVNSLASTFGGYADALDLIISGPFQAPELRRLQAALAGDGAPAPDELRRLHRITTFAQPPTSQIYPLIEYSTLWNVHVLWALERWQATASPRVRPWLAALGEMEALASLARLGHDNPTWAFPDVDPTVDILTARDLAHPLLRADVRVANDVELGPPGSFLLVTGSNMSGKSTLLRAIGLNVVLAQAGAPACATQLRLPALDLWTSMRVQDSLERGVSYFMAELERLKQVVDAARAERGERCLLYLLDEILQGTNTAERQIAARRIIRLLLRCPAIGAVSTHDLTLADSEDLAAPAHAVHLTESIADEAAGPRMSFDYTLRPGVARSTNALRLMELVGLPTE